jgi:hypothetical protein
MFQAMPFHRRWYLRPNVQTCVTVSIIWKKSTFFIVDFTPAFAIIADGGQHFVGFELTITHAMKDYNIKRSIKRVFL